MVKIIVDSKCSGCETCVNTCPVSVYEMNEGKAVPVKVDECIVCRTCESQCPEGAIQVFEKVIEPAKVERTKLGNAKKKTKKITKKNK